jgi:hypothetical protein
LSNLLKRCEEKRSRKLATKYEIAKKFLEEHREVATEPNFTNQLPAMRRQFGVNRKPMPLLAMKYAIGEIIFLKVRFRRSMGPVISEPRATARNSSEVSHEVRNWQNLFPRASYTCAQVVGRHKVSATRSLLGPSVGTKIHVSHERFNWPKFLITESSSPNKLGGVFLNVPHHILFQQSRVSMLA